MAGVPLVHVALVVQFAVEASEYVHVAVAADACPTVCVEGTSDTAIDESVTTGALQVSVVFPETAPTWAVMVEEPALLQFPLSVLESGPTVATDGVPLDHVETLVRFWVEESE